MSLTWLGPREAHTNNFATDYPFTSAPGTNFLPAFSTFSGCIRITFLCSKSYIRSCSSFFVSFRSLPSPRTLSKYRTHSKSENLENRCFFRFQVGCAISDRKVIQSFPVVKKRQLTLSFFNQKIKIASSSSSSEK